MSTVRELVIRRAQEPDREWCARLMSSSEPWITLLRGLKESRALLRRTGVELFVGREGRHRLGFILVQPYGLAGSPYVASLAVIAGARSRGVGARLMAFAEQRFAPRRHLFLCVSSFNRRAQHFYRRLGYSRVAEFADYIVDGHSEVLMYKKLS